MRGAYTASSATNYSTFSLYNNGSGADMLVVWAIWFNDGASGYVANVAAYQGTLGAKLGLVVPFITGYTQQSGLLYWDDDATQITPDFYTQTFPGQGLSIPASIPYAILQPGWSYVAQSGGTGNAGSVGWIWQLVHPEDVIGRRCSICDADVIVTT